MTGVCGLVTLKVSRSSQNSTKRKPCPRVEVCVGEPMMVPLEEAGGGGGGRPGWWRAWV